MDLLLFFGSKGSPAQSDDILAYETIFTGFLVIAFQICAGKSRNDTGNFRNQICKNTKTQFYLFSPGRFHQSSVFRYSWFGTVNAALLLKFPEKSFVILKTGTSGWSIKVRRTPRNGRTTHSDQRLKISKWGPVERCKKNTLPTLCQHVWTLVFAKEQQRNCGFRMENNRFASLQGQRTMDRN